MGVSITIAVLGIIFFPPSLPLQQLFDSMASSVGSNRSENKIHRSLLLVSRDGLIPKSQDFATLYDEEVKCVEALMTQGALAVGVLQKDPTSQRERFLHQKLGTNKRVVLFPVDGSFLKTFPPSDKRFEISYPIGPNFSSFASRMLKAAQLSHALGFVRLEIADKVESPSVNLSHIQRILQSPVRTRELVTDRIIVLTPHRDLTAWREWQCLEAVAGDKGPLPRPGTTFSMLWTFVAVVCPSLCIYLPLRRDLRANGMMGSFSFLALVWLVTALLGGLSLEVLPWFAGWLSPSLLWLILAGISGMVFHFFPSLGTAQLREILQGPRLIPIPISWKKPSFYPPFPRMAPLQKTAAELLLQSLGRPKHRKSDLESFLKKYDAITAVRLATRN